MEKGGWGCVRVAIVRKEKRHMPCKSGDKVGGRKWGKPGCEKTKQEQNKIAAVSRSYRVEQGRPGGVARNAECMLEELGKGKGGRKREKRNEFRGRFGPREGGVVNRVEVRQRRGVEGRPNKPCLRCKDGGEKKRRRSVQGNSKKWF